MEEILQSKISLINHAGGHYRGLDWKNKLCAVQDMIQPSSPSPVDLEQQLRSWVVKNLLGLGREETKGDQSWLRFFLDHRGTQPLLYVLPIFHWCLTLKVHVRASIGEAPLCSPAVIHRVQLDISHLSVVVVVETDVCKNNKVSVVEPIM